MKNLIIALSALMIFACFGDKTSSKNDNSCNSSSCLSNICPGYSTSSYSEEGSSDVCSIQGSCEIPMSLTYQLSLQIPGKEISCGPVTGQMIVNAVLDRIDDQASGWLDSYSSISASSDPTGSSTGYCNNDKDCKQVLAIGTEMIGTSWAQSPKRVNAVEMASFFDQRVNEMSSEQGGSAKQYDSSIYPSEINECTFAIGEQALTNSHPWTYSILYLEYPINTSASSTYNGTELLDVTLKDQINGHYIALSGYQTSNTGISFKFNDPIYGIKYYTMTNIKEDEPVCIVRASDSICSLYLRIKDLPSGFKGAGTFLVASPGEEKASGYTFKFIASISGITPVSANQ